MNAAEIRSLLNQRAEEVCRLLLPSGKRVKGQWHAGDVRGGPGDSLKVHLEGQYLGFWKDFANDSDKGSLLDLWMKVKGIPFKSALEEAAKFLNVELTHDKDFYQRGTRNAERGIGIKQDFVPAKEGGAAWEYLTKRRGLKAETLKAFGVCETLDGKAMVFPYRSPDGSKTEMVKYIKIERSPEGKKESWTSSGTPKVLFGKEAVRTNLGELILCEGEIDAMTIWQCGFSAVSVPYGAQSETKDGRNPNQPWIEHDFDFLEKFQSIYLCFDSDEPGRKAAACLVKPLGMERCLLVRLPEDGKDPNELLMKGRLGELGKAIGNAKSLDPEHLKGAEEFQDAVYERFFPKDGEEKGLPFLWGNFPFRVRPGELTVWTGFSGHGKTMLLLHLMVHLMQLGERVCVASMEIPADMTLQNMWTQCSARKKPENDAEFERFYQWLVGKVWIYDRMGDVDPREVISVFTYAARRYGVTQFVVDSLDKLNVGRDDYDRQKQVLGDLCAMANQMGAHVHLVAHSRKPEHNDESNVPGKYDVSGSAAITNLAWNGITVWRNKKKEEALKEGSPDYEEDGNEREFIRLQHDAFFRIWKQREPPGDEPVKKLWYDREAKQYHERADYEGSKVYATTV